MDNEAFDQTKPSLFKNLQLPLVLGVIGILVLIIGIRLIVFPLKEPQINFSDEASVSAQKASEIKIDISGAVIKPGVYTLSSESRVQDLLIAAGGLSPDADRDWVSKKINLAAKLTDGGKIYIPKVNEINIQNQGGQVIEDTSSNYNININNASKSDLDTLPGIGEVTAQKIIDGRPYQSVQDLLTKKIVGQSVFEKIKDKISAY